DAELAQGGDHDAGVLAGERADEAAGLVRQGGQHQGAVGDALGARHADRGRRRARQRRYRQTRWVGKTGGHAPYRSYVPRVRTSPWAGAVGPACVRSSARRMSGTADSGQWPRPTLIRVPAMARTILYRKPSASTSIQTQSAKRLTARCVTVRTLDRRLGQSVSKLW